ncbi:MAG: class I SAM-dependent methyltransferase [Planctomycetota bacterium]
MGDGIEYHRVADLYDEFVRTELDFPFFLAEARKTSGEVLELTAGTGRVSVPLLKAGIDLCCVDRSPDMLAILEKKLAREGLTADIHEMDIRDLELGRTFGLAIVPFHAFSELVAEDDRRRTLERIRDHLVEGGRLILTLHNPGRRGEPVDGVRRRELDLPRRDAPGRLELWVVEEWETEGSVVKGTEWFQVHDETGRMVSELAHDFRHVLLGREEVEAMAAAVGFRVAALYGDYEYSEFRADESPSMVWVFER